MNRRAFLTTTAWLPVVGCGRSKPNPIPKDDAERTAHLTLLESYRVPADAKRTTRPRSWGQLLDIFPELKTRARVAVRLHPRFGSEPGATESKLGGAFAWPTSEPWPEEKGQRYLPTVQLRQADCPPTLKFQPGKDLLQILLHPKAESKAMLFWRTLANLKPPFAEIPTSESPADYPVPCRFFPERIADYPDIERMPDGAFKDRLKLYLKEHANDFPNDYYAKYLAAAPGYKIGGYVHDRGVTMDASCPKCRKAMEFVMTLAAHDWGHDPKWAPIEEESSASPTGYAMAPDFPRGQDRHIFTCTRCIDPPAKVVLG